MAKLGMAYAKMKAALRMIAYEFEDPAEMEERSEKIGLSREEYLEMAYENMQGTARACLEIIGEGQ